ncbi:MAG: hypothetical protein ABUK01_04435 [Leptospirales bacterium]
MVNRNSEPLYRLGVHVDHFLEIRVNANAWEKVVRISEAKKTSYSWVVRYCVFRLIKRKDPFMFITNCVLKSGKHDKWKKYQSLNRRVKLQSSEEHLHRHKLCLYGSDEMFIRMTAGLMHWTMSRLVRLALEWYLDELVRGLSENSSQFHRLAFYWLGIKLYGGVELPTSPPEYVRLQLDRFHESEYW